MQHGERRGLEAALLAFSLWGFLTIYWKQLAHLPAFEMIGWRVVTATLLMVVVVAVRGRLAPIRAALADRPTRRRIVLAAALLTANWTTYVWAIGDGRVVETALGYFLAPLGTIAMGTMLLGERLSQLQWMSVGCTVVAVGVLTVSYGELPWVALVLGITWSWYGLIKRGVPLGPTESITSELLIAGVPGAVLAASGWFRDGGVPDVASGVDWMLVAGTGVTTAVPLVLFAYAAPRVPFTLLGPATYLIPVIHFLLGWLAYDEEMPVSRFVGFGFVWVALTLVTVDRLRAERLGAVLAAEAEPVTP